jgi:hypothetical protein
MQKQKKHAVSGTYSVMLNWDAFWCRIYAIERWEIFLRTTELLSSWRHVSFSFIWRGRLKWKFTELAMAEIEYGMEGKNYTT